MALVEAEFTTLQHQSSKLDQLLLVFIKSAKPSSPDQPEKPVAVAM